MTVQSAFDRLHPVSAIRAAVRTSISMLSAPRHIVVVGKIRPNVPQPRGAQHRIDDGVRDHVGVAMTGERPLTDKPDPTEHQRPPRVACSISERVRIVAVTHSHRRAEPAAVNRRHTR